MNVLYLTDMLHLNDVICRNLIKICYVNIIQICSRHNALAPRCNKKINMLSEHKPVNYIFVFLFYLLRQKTAVAPPSFLCTRNPVPDTSPWGFTNKNGTFFGVQHIGARGGFLSLVLSSPLIPENYF